MARPRSPDYPQQRGEMLARAAQCFAARGYHGTSMNDIAAACGVTKPALYHYFPNKEALLAAIAQGHIDHLEAIVAEVGALQLPAAERLRELIERFVRDYGRSQAEHRVLTEDVKFLPAPEREQVLAGERRVVAAFADTIAELRPGTRSAGLHKPLTMLLFGMMNWLFTWLKPGGALTHAALAGIVSDLFFGGLPAVAVPRPARRAAEPLTTTAEGDHP